MGKSAFNRSLGQAYDFQSLGFPAYATISTACYHLEWLCRGGCSSSIASIPTLRPPFLVLLPTAIWSGVRFSTSRFRV